MADNDEHIDIRSGIYTHVQNKLTSDTTDLWRGKSALHAKSYADIHIDNARARHHKTIVTQEYLNSRTSDSTITIDEVIYPDDDDADNGEPFQPQHLVIDFTPIPGVDDDEEILQNCEDFWAFFRNEPKLQGMMVEPEMDMNFKSIESKHTSDVGENKEKSAVEIMGEMPLEILRGAGRNPMYKHCPASGSSSTGLAPEKKDEHRTWRWRGDLPVMDFSKECVHSECVCPECVCEDKYQAIADAETKQLCMEMKQFDETHPKSFDPPGLPPRFINTVLQRVPH
ncbi:uncharacterized protein LOC126368636 [Pectinophora gossypiella]|uniref:uncharacterized protein LOC126368636 n=1 Tax=Pectinophora gossypiella TaxID=13191 RepID=UPI00214E2301|nr:uncharacterized protein LOC126368636 [Pectinophora gossypiella]